MKASELIKIIETCGNNNVTEFNNGEISIKFASVDCVQTKYIKGMEADMGESLEGVTEDSSFPLFDSDETEEDREEEQVSRELILSNPAEYESQIFEHLQSSSQIRRKLH